MLILVPGGVVVTASSWTDFWDAYEAEEKRLDEKQPLAGVMSRREVTVVVILSNSFINVSQHCVRLADSWVSVRARIQTI